jgi:succinate-semialdehyde dehydrogenase/glutarate-semialdehyde dehydrogenase
MPTSIKPSRALASKFRNAGQTCVCANRLYVQDGVYDRFAEKLQQAVEKLRIGDGLQDGVTTGPLIDEKAVAKVEEHIADAIAKGAKVVTGGKPHALGGNFFQPTILVNVPDSAKVAKEETFGPLAPLFRFKDEADVIAQANDTEFGLAAYFYARDLSRVFRVGEALEYGIIGINTGIISTEVARSAASRLRPRPRRVEVRHRRLFRNQIYVYWPLTGATDEQQ